MKLTFKKEQIELSQGCERTYQLNELNSEKIIEILELCIQYEDDLNFEIDDDATPISKKLCELIKTGLKETKETASE